MIDHIPDVTKMIGETPRTDAAWKPDGGDGYPTVDVDVARQLERELNVANERIKNLESALSTVENIDKVNAYQDLESANERIKRLEDIIEKASEHFRRAGPNAFTAYEMADVLKEAKP